jgi:hypothetical protein
MNAQSLADGVERKQTFICLIAYPLSRIAGLLPANRAMGRTTAQAFQSVSQHREHQPLERTIICVASAGVVVLGPGDYITSDKSLDYVHRPFRFAI